MKKCPKCGREFEDPTTLCPSDGEVLEETGDTLIGQTLAEKYRIEEIINKGGMGAVYRATHVLMDKTVAVKVLHPALAADNKIVARFSREAKAASRISHPHALTVTDFGESDNGIVYLVMEYLRGQTLKEAIRSEGPLELSRAVEIIRQVSGALEAAHNEGVVHRDLKSDNIMLVEMGTGGDWAKVLDFGIAKIIEKVGQDPELTAPNFIIGTPQYMSPEQCSQVAEIDSRSDIYSLGVIIYEMLVGHVPFSGESPTAIMMKHLQDPPPSILDERKDVPSAVARVGLRAMSKRPEDRFQTAGELSDELTAAASEVEAIAPVPVVSDVESPASDRITNRIVVPTGSNELPRHTSEDAHDESTLVRSRPEATAEPEVEIITNPDEVVANFNPWRILIPAMAALLVIFGAVFALTRNSSSEPTANSNSTPLVDPASQPVKAAEPATGAGERDIAPSSPVNARDANANIPTEPGVDRDQPGTVPANANQNASTGPGANSTPEPDESKPSPNKNSNQRRELPKPNINVAPNPEPAEPPPPPQQTPKPTTSGEGPG